MSFAKLSLLLLAPLVAAEDDVDGGTCEVKHNRTLTNCWGADLKMYDRPGESWEDCCQACADIPDGKCKVFTFDVWNATGHRQNYCFFKSRCSDTRPSDTAISGINPRIKPTPEPPTPEPTPPPTPKPSPTPEPTPTPTDQPQCRKPEAADSPGLGDATPINVSSKDDCCHRCEAPACTYVAFGQYQNSSDWACFLHGSKNDTSTARAAASAILVRQLSSSNGAKSCADFGLTGCLGANVVMPPVPVVHAPRAWLAVSGVATFFFAMFLGFGFSRRLKLAGKFVK